MLTPLHSDLKVGIGGKLKEPRITIAGIILCDCPEFLASISGEDCSMQLRSEHIASTVHLLF